jgi:dTDP-4-dehydrorhamnose reductase
MTSKPKIALIGSRGMLGQAVLGAARHAYDVVGFSRTEVDFLRPCSVENAVRKADPDVIVNCAAFTAVDACETEEETATRINGDGPGLLARLALRSNATLVHISTDYVFDGKSQTPYCEGDVPSPVSAYGRSKLAGENAIMDSGLARFFIVRTSWLYGFRGKNFVETILRLANEQQELRVVADQTGSPTFTDDLAVAILELLKTRAYGLYHCSNEGSCTWHEFACGIVRGGRQRGLKLRVERIRPVVAADFPLPAPRPAYSLLSKDKYRTATGREFPHWSDALKRYLDRRLGVRGANRKEGDPAAGVLLSHVHL